MVTNLKGLRALTLKPEPANLVVNGSKRVENRSWQGRVGELIAIHRGGKGGGIVALAVVREILEAADALKKYPDQKKHIKGPLCWILDEVRTFSPVECRGQLSLWRVSDELVSQIERRLTNG